MRFKAIIIAGIFLAFGVSAGFAQTESKVVPKYVPDIADFMNIGRASAAGYSPDGKTIYFKSRMSGVYQYYALGENGWPYQLTVFEDGVDFFKLSHDGTKAIVGASKGGSEQSNIYLIDPKTGRLEQLTAFKDVQVGSVHWSPDDRYIYYRSNEENGRDFFIYQMDVATKQARKVLGDDTVNGYLGVMDLSTDGNKLLAYRFYSNSDMDLYLLDLTSGEYSQLTQDDKEVRYSSAYLMPDNKTIHLLCNDNKDGIQLPATMTVGSPKVTYSYENWLDPRWEVDDLVVSDDHRFMAAIVNENGYERLRLYDIKAGASIPAPPASGEVADPIFDDNGDVIFSFRSPSKTQDVWKWSPTTQTFDRKTFSTYAGIDPNEFVDPELVSYKSFDGLEIPAFLYLPKDYKEGEPIPFVVYAHGGPGSQTKAYFSALFQYLVMNGYGVFAPNVRGSSGYGVEYRAADDYKNRIKSLKDYKAGVDYLFEKNYTKPGIIGIRGGSYGGYVVLGMITEYPDLFSAAVDVVGIANFETFLKNTKAYRRSLREAEYGPLSDPEFLRSISPVHKADKIKTPLLVIHGENDPRVPADEARQMLAAVADNGSPIDSLFFPDEGHVIKKTSNLVLSYRKHVEFLDRFLKKD